ncbi:FecR domain-containing protein [Pseudomonas sp. B21-035]|uniref:FecR family protein n=1 Tax=Pseudomonas sp. B21-035 TaxID=2895484 RepID=UPI002160B2C0|nr:FecR domain-containing protein [Pseudomonas sp. B21-035]UVL57202.1 FecR domain-containing protein [Pseudomonas sp. B21-035]
MTAQASIEQHAAEWILRLGEGELSEAERQALEAWRRQDARHEATFTRMQAILEQMHSLRPQRQPVRAALRTPANGQRRAQYPRRVLLGLALLAALGVPLSLSGWHPQNLLADLHTAPAQWQSHTLSDGTRVILEGNSALDLRFSAHERRIELLRGKVLVDVAHDSSRPFVVATADGTFQALGTRFVVARGGAGSELTMLESQVMVRSAEQDKSLAVGKGGRAWVRRDDLGLLASIDPASVDQAWQRHQLVVEQSPLVDVLDALARQRRGHLSFDRKALADLRVSAVLPLDDSERALQLLAEVLPISIHSHTAWWTRIERRSADK